MKEITTQELFKLTQSTKDFILLDCRGVDYFNWEHLPGALNLRWKYVAEKALHYNIYMGNKGVGGTGSTETWIKAGINHHLALTAHQVASLSS